MDKDYKRIFSVIWLAGDVKEPALLSERVGDEIPGVVVLVSRVGASHRVNLMHLSPLVRKCPRKVTMKTMTMKLWLEC